MKLPDDSLGVTDMMGWRDCPRRMSFGMRRHTDAGEHPEAESASTAYGSAFHEAVAYAEEHDAFDDEAIQYAFDKYARWLDPDDLRLLKEDMVTYRARDYENVRTKLVEGEFKIPMFEHEGVTYYFRGKIDRLYQSRDDPGLFIHVDYKTSRWQKTKEEVHADIQMWAYNFAIHHIYPECRELIQVYDQLRYGPEPTRKTPQQRELVREWLCRQMLTIIKDDKTGSDGLLLPKKNQWCAYCTLLPSCDIVKEYTEFALVEIATLAPEYKDGRKTVVDIDTSRIEDYTRRLESVTLAKNSLERFEDAVKALLKAMPQDRREELGYTLTTRSNSVFPAEALKATHRALGDQFYDMIGLSQESVKRTITDKDLQDQILSYADKRPGATYITKKRKKAPKKK